MLVQTAIVGFPEYHKIDTLFERDPSTFVVDETKLKKPVLATISTWEVTEKIDGTNIRLMLSAEGQVQCGGRTDKAQLPADLLSMLYRRFTPENLKAACWLNWAVDVVLFGEAYGAGIQKGGSYRADKSFILFDVLIGGKWWLDRAAVETIAAKLSTEVVPLLGRMSLEEIVTLVRAPFPSKIGTAIAEGIVARPIETLFDNRGERLIIKLKTKDFVRTK